MPCSSICWHFTASIRLEVSFSTLGLFHFYFIVERRSALPPLSHHCSIFHASPAEQHKMSPLAPDITRVGLPMTILPGLSRCTSMLAQHAIYLLSRSAARFTFKLSASCSTNYRWGPAAAVIFHLITAHVASQPDAITSFSCPAPPFRHAPRGTGFYLSINFF